MKDYTIHVNCLPGDHAYVVDMKRHNIVEGNLTGLHIHRDMSISGNMYDGHCHMVCGPVFVTREEAENKLKES